MNRRLRAQRGGDGIRPLTPDGKGADRVFPRGVRRRPGSAGWREQVRFRLRPREVKLWHGPRGLDRSFSLRDGGFAVPEDVVRGVRGRDHGAAVPARLLEDVEERLEFAFAKSFRLFLLDPVAVHGVEPSLILRRGGVHRRRAVGLEPAGERRRPGLDVPRRRDEPGHRVLVVIVHCGEGREADVAVGVEVHLHGLRAAGSLLRGGLLRLELGALGQQARVPARGATAAARVELLGSEKRGGGCGALGAVAPHQRGSVGRHLGLVLPRLGLAGPRASVRVAVLL